LAVSIGNESSGSVGKEPRTSSTKSAFIHRGAFRSLPVPGFAHLIQRHEEKEADLVA
jgi:hypothetical protein